MVIPGEAPLKSMGYWTSYELLCTFVILECVRQKDFKSIYEESVAKILLGNEGK
jgi:hypothetical protein